LVDKTISTWSKHLKPAYEVSQVATALGLAAEGEGVSILPSYAISRGQAASQVLSIATVALVGPVVAREIVALTPAKAKLPVAAQAFMEHFKKHAGKY
jgi:LysR family transcriptional regulator, carnitine catabolism transcriptional activator